MHRGKPGEVFTVPRTVAGEKALSEEGFGLFTRGRSGGK